jgi:hypothetical protein
MVLRATRSDLARGAVGLPKDSWLAATRRFGGRSGMVFSLLEQTRGRVAGSRCSGWSR